MATATANAPRESKSAADPERKFKVLKTQVGPWSKGQVFSLSTFKELHPLYESTRPRPKGFDAAKYHDGLIKRLIETGAAEETNGDAEESEISPGPLAQPQEKFEDPHLKRIVETVTNSLTAGHAAKSPKE